MPNRLKMHLQFFAEDDNKEKPPEGDPPAGNPEIPDPAPAPENDLTTMLLDIQGLLSNMQQTLDKLAPVSEEPPASTPPEGDPPADEEPPAEEELKELDRILQSE